MCSKSITARGTTWVVVAGALIVAGSAAAQMRGGGGYSSMSNTAPTTPSTTYNMSSREAQPISDVKDPTTTLASARVQDSSGQTIGHVQKVSTTADGKASIVYVSLATSGGAGKVVSFDANGLRYDSDSKTLKASLTQSEINALPVTQSP